MTLQLLRGKTMKNEMILIVLASLSLASCGKINESMQALECNRQAIDMSTQVIYQNVQAVQEANQSIDENRRRLDEINNTLKQAAHL